MWKIKLVLALIGFVYSITGLTHNFEVTKASLTILDNQQYRIQVDLDLIELLQIGANLNGDDSELIDQVRKMSLSDVRRARSRAINQLAQRSYLIVDNYSITLNKIEVTDTEMMHAYLQRPNQDTEYRALMMVKGVLPDNINQIQLELPDFLGKVDLVINQPLKQLVAAGKPSVAYDLTHHKQSLLELCINYLVQGFEHVVPLGIDHILFVLLLFLCTSTLRELVLNVSLFTIAHSITLSLATLGWIQITPSIIEPLIALTIILLAVQVLLKKHPARQRLMIFIFGLLHGLGFASVFSEIAAPGEQLVLSLLSFNLGVEAGQLTVIGLAALVCWSWRQQTIYIQRVVPITSGVIAIVGFYWFVERLV
ncbi:HupE/UreJ family protein [Paraglaciecola hydrolytica]|uniref:HupE/UreJ protein n=1 Tax=Paraglaciecola hydrolytica TaxID=1799789 RepID=A0A148KKX9_9ALTE|nr:HupE/UreJ family protein [Paraglaciecola hydrolytica]KXI26929.1 hypothetical protein AX660_02150 [Paraglaciecola hydrolytica]